MPATATLTVRKADQASSLSDVRNQQSLINLIGNRSHTSGLLAIHGGNAENLLTAAAVVYAIDGVLYSKAAQTEIDVSGLAFVDEYGDATPNVALANNQACVYLLVMNAAGTIKVVQGPVVASNAAVNWPRCPASHAPFGGVKVVNESGSAFTFGTTDLDTTDVTDTYYNLSVVPNAAA